MGGVHNLRPIREKKFAEIKVPLTRNFVSSIFRTKNPECTICSLNLRSKFLVLIFIVFHMSFVSSSLNIIPTNEMCYYDNNNFNPQNIALDKSGYYGLSQYFTNQFEKYDYGTVETETQFELGFKFNKNDIKIIVEEVNVKETFDLTNAPDIIDLTDPTGKQVAEVIDLTEPDVPEFTKVTPYEDLKVPSAEETDGLDIGGISTLDNTLNTISGVTHTTSMAAGYYMLGSKVSRWAIASTEKSFGEIGQDLYDNKGVILSTVGSKVILPYLAKGAISVTVGVSCPLCVTGITIAQIAMDAHVTYKAVNQAVEDYNDIKKYFENTEPEKIDLKVEEIIDHLHDIKKDLEKIREQYEEDLPSEDVKRKKQKIASEEKINTEIKTDLVFENDIGGNELAGDDSGDYKPPSGCIPCFKKKVKTPKSGNFTTNSNTQNNKFSSYVSQLASYTKTYISRNFNFTYPVLTKEKCDPFKFNQVLDNFSKGCNSLKSKINFEKSFKVPMKKRLNNAKKTSKVGERVEEILPELAYPDKHKIVNMFKPFGKVDIPFLDYVIVTNENGKKVTSLLEVKSIRPKDFKKYKTDKKNNPDQARLYIEVNKKSVPYLKQLTNSNVKFVIIIENNILDGHKYEAYYVKIHNEWEVPDNCFLKNLKNSERVKVRVELGDKFGKDFYNTKDYKGTDKKKFNSFYKNFKETCKNALGCYPKKS